MKIQRSSGPGHMASSDATKVPIAKDIGVEKKLAFEPNFDKVKAAVQGVSAADAERQTLQHEIAEKEKEAQRLQDELKQKKGESFFGEIGKFFGDDPGAVDIAASSAPVTKDPNKK